MTDRSVKDVNERQREEARARAREDFINSRFTGSRSPAPDLERWPPAYRRAFEEELRRLEGR